MLNLCYMCCGGVYLDITTGKLIKVFFPIPNVLIPVIDERGVYFLCQWGQRENDKDLIFDLPVTGWARIESTDKFYWQKHKPRKVTVPFQAFMEKDKNDPIYPRNKACEFELKNNEGIEGLLIEHTAKSIVYIVTKPIKNWIHDRYPVVVERKEIKS